MHRQGWILIAALLLATGIVWLRGGFVGVTSTFAQQPKGGTLMTPPAQPGVAVATFASGCFWSTEVAFDKAPGVISTTSGYTGGRVPNPTYRQVGSGSTGHAEAVYVVYDASVTSYDALLEHYWHNVDPFVGHRQFCDVGDSYRPVIFYHSEDQRTAAEASKARMQQRFAKPIVVAIAPAMPFYRAEEYHQDYYLKNATQYSLYRFACGRDRRISEIWAGASAE
jgi:peptide-methionine (S)-S-oxide reductase